MELSLPEAEKDFVSSKENSALAPPDNGVFLLRIHALVEPVSNNALIFYGGVPT